MPEDFDRCINTKGSRKVTKSLGGGKYVYGCKFPDGDWVWGEVHERKGNKLREAIKGSK